jgi:hypothetical protein
MQNIKCVKLSSYPIYSLCNQLYFIAHALTNAISLHKEIFIVNSFYTDIDTHDNCPISFILDLYKTNLFLDKYNIKIIDTYNLTFKIVSIKIGEHKNTVDITSKIMNLQNKDLLKNKLFYISKDINLIELTGEPLSNVNIEKKVYIEYEICGYIFQNEYAVKNGFLTNDIHMNMNSKFLKYDNYEYFNTVDKNNDIFNDILQNIQFHSKYIYRSQNIIKNINNCSDKINVIHLRIEHDAIEHWSKMNDISVVSFKRKLEDKYIYFIQKYIQPSDLLFILSYETDNNIIQFLKQNKYNIYINKKYNDQGREINALQDMCIGEYCNNVFIGPTLSSMFSNILHLRLKLKDNIKMITFNMEKINDEENYIK